MQKQNSENYVTCWIPTFQTNTANIEKTFFYTTKGFYKLKFRWFQWMYLNMSALVES